MYHAHACMHACMTHSPEATTYVRMYAVEYPPFLENYLCKFKSYSMYWGVGGYLNPQYKAKAGLMHRN